LGKKNMDPAGGASKPNALARPKLARKKTSGRYHGPTKRNAERPANHRGGGKDDVKPPACGGQVPPKE